MRIIGFAGWSGAGKTHVLRLLLPVLVERGLSVSTLYRHAGAKRLRLTKVGGRTLVDAGSLRRLLSAETGE